jgi:hypothetical protein
VRPSSPAFTTSLSQADVKVGNDGWRAVLAVSDVVVFVCVSTSHSTSSEFFVNHLTNLSFG